MFALRAHGLKTILRHISASSMAMDAAPTKRLIEKKLTEGLAPALLQVEDVSHQHAGHAGAPRGSSETHFNVTVVSEVFQGRSLLKRHRLVYDLLQEELQHGGVHALSLNTKTPAEVQRVDHGQDYICDVCETHYGPWSKGRASSRASSPKPCPQHSKPSERKESPLCETCEAEKASWRTKQKRA